MSEVQSTVNYRDVAGFPGYRVGDDGSVWSCRKIISLGWRNGTYSIAGDVWKQLKARPNKSGHLQVVLMPGRRMRYVHHLVLEAFVGLRPPRTQARHFPDRNPTNNRLSNLSWDTAKTNQQDRRVHGTDNCGERGGTAKLTEEKVIAIMREKPRTWKEYAEVGQRHGVSDYTIFDLVRGRTWKYITNPGGALFQS